MRKEKRMRKYLLDLRMAMELGTGDMARRMGVTTNYYRGLEKGYIRFFDVELMAGLAGIVEKESRDGPVLEYKQLAEQILSELVADELIYRSEELQ